MNRRDALKSIGAGIFGAFVPAVKVDERDAKIAELEATIAELDAEAEYYFQWGHEQSEHSFKWWRRWFDAESIASDLAVQVAYWQEQYEQMASHCDTWREQYEELTDLYNAAILSKWFNGNWKTTDEWLNSKADDCQFEVQVQQEQCETSELGRIIYVDGDSITDGHRNYTTIAEALDDSEPPEPMDITIIIDSDGARLADA